MIKFYVWLTSAPTARGLWLVAGLLAVITISIVFIIAKLKHQDNKNLNFLLSLIDKYKTQIITGELLVIIIATGLILLPAPIIISPRLPVFDPIQITHDNPFIIEFDRPISKSIKARILPSVSGEWRIESGTYPSLPNRLVFYPSQSLKPDVEYSVDVERILPTTWILLKSAAKTLFVFKTPPLPEVSAIDPKDGQSSFGVDDPISISFNQASSTQVEWSYDLSPSIDNQIVFSENLDQMIITPTSSLNHNTSYTITIYRTPLEYDYLKNTVILRYAKEQVYKSSFTTVSSASLKEITSYSNNVFPDAPINIIWNEAMQKQLTQNAISVTPDNPLIFSWSSDSEMTISPKLKWELDTDYTLNITTDAMSQIGGHIAEPIIHRFNTIGAVEILESKPVDLSNNHPVDQPISVTFDQPVDIGSVEDKFSISPSIEGNFSWQDYTLTFTPNDSLSHQTTYTITMSEGVTSLYGKDSNRKHSFTFTTAPQIYMLNLPYYKQTYAFTCFSVTSQMVLAYRGITSIDQVGFMEEIGYDTTPRNYSANTWGDPNQGVVGSIDGSGSGGYGTHWGPVAKALSKYVEVEIKRDWNISELLSEVNHNNPVMVWWINGVWPAKNVSWNTPSGELVYTVNGMHVEVVKGYIGTINDPQYILTSDPWRGERRYTPESFNNLWKWFNNTAIVVK